MRTLSWLFSFVVHVAAVLLLAGTVNYTLPTDDQKIINVELTEPEPAPVPQPLPKPSGSPESSVRQPCPPEQQAPALPMDKTVVLTKRDISPAPSTGPEPEPASEPVPEIAAKPISPKALAEAEVGEADYHVRMDGVAHRGAEARFGRMMFADYYSYSPDEFAGQFRVEGDRVVTIIDARSTKYGRFLIYDSKLGYLRRLKKFNKYIYTIGPSLEEDKPVTGSVTFLAKDDRIERFIYLPDGEKGLFPSKIHFREEKKHFSVAGEQLDAIVTLPPAQGKYAGVVLVHGSDCIPPAMVQGAVRALGMHGTAIIAFSPRGCGSDTGGQATHLVQDAAAALASLRKHKEVNSRRVGVLGIGKGSVEAVAVANAGGADFLICMPGEGGSEVRPNMGAVASVKVPSLWIVSSKKQWRSFVKGLEQVRDVQKRPVTVVVDDLEKQAGIGTGGESALVKAVSTGHAGLAASWIAGLD